MKNPKASYRIQFHKGFNFRDFEQIENYLKTLGISTLYASPIFTATPGSVHGYDVCNPNQINPEIGDEAQLIRISESIKNSGIMWLQDVVPNHMAFHTDNPWLVDVLEKGNRSVFKLFFDSAFTCPVMKGKLMVPFLGKSLDDTIEQGELQLVWTGKKLSFTVNQQNYPLKPSSYRVFLEKLSLQQAQTELEHLGSITDAKTFGGQWEKVLSLIQPGFNEDKAEQLQQVLEAYNQNPSLLKDLLHAQHYQLCQWQQTNNRINYRRFFTVNALICLNMQYPSVFEQHHRLLKKLLDDGIFDGLRVDHVDGLLEPSGYLKQLRQLAGKETYITVEKILAADEQLPSQWPVQGSTGYDFLAVLNNLFTNANAEADFTAFYQTLTGDDEIAPAQLKKKRYILDHHMAGELENLSVYFDKLGLNTNHITHDILKEALAAFLVYMPVYRFYGEDFPFQKQEQQALLNLFERLKRDEPHLLEPLQALQEVLLYADDQAPIHKKAVANFFKRCMQFSGPLMAKGLEDTLMYANFRFIAHNEVGDHPSNFGISKADFHRFMQNRQLKSPLALNATATHDTKRGEDARARLNVLTAMPDLWFKTVAGWRKVNKAKVDALGISSKAEYFVYQSLLAHFPLENTEVQSFGKRFKDYLQKAFREGKEYSDWANVDSNFEQCVSDFVDYLLADEGNFNKHFRPFAANINRLGQYVSLAQLGLKFMCPGVPDVYQGTELWDFSFVDPDNRREVDYGLREKLLAQSQQISFAELLRNSANGAVKLRLTQKLYLLRRSYPELFSEGEYFPLTLKGKYKDAFIAFKREVASYTFVAIALVDLSEINGVANFAWPDFDWEDTRLEMPEQTGWYQVFEKTIGNGQQLLLNDLKMSLPISILQLDTQKTRKAGVLMHISSLPSAFSYGDLGPEAYRFADFLQQAGQQYWQMLPIGPGASTHNLSPYSALSSMAGNPLFISHEYLMKQGLLSLENLQQIKDKSQGNSFEAYHQQKFALLKSAFEKHLEIKKLKSAVTQFVVQEESWLKDFALYMVLRNHFDAAWHQWPKAYRDADEATLNRFATEHQQDIQEQYFYQYIFSQQWNALKNYCHAKNIRLIGDLPFYLNHDSADVWKNPELFALNTDGSMAEVAGVPPDYFAADGQLWGMPVYKWQQHRQSNYAWWLHRLEKNMERFDLLRLDHFRAFRNYWAVDAGERSAVGGQWREAPGAEFFNAVKERFPHLPFIAEDLGDIDAGVYQLRDEFNLAGMRVLQFAFNQNLAVSPHAPHLYNTNTVVYTATHDNNTTKAWWKSLSEDEQLRVCKYIGKSLHDENIAETLINMAYASSANTSIIPVQDILNLDEDARMNVPGTNEGNWHFQLKERLSEMVAKNLRERCHLYGRCGM